MANKNLTTNYLSRLSNANHDGVSQQICDRLRDFETENQMLIQAVNGVHQARQAEDTARIKGSLIFFSKKFVNSHNKLYLCSVFV